MPTNTLNVPPAPVKLAPVPSEAVATTCAELVKNAVVESEPDLSPKIVTESVAFILPFVAPSLTFTFTSTVSPSPGSLASGKVNVEVVLILPEVDPSTKNS